MKGDYPKRGDVYWVRLDFGAGPPGRYVWVTLFPGFAYPSGEPQPGLLHEQTLRAVCNLFLFAVPPRHIQHSI